jgi:peroxiredoxin
MPTSRTLATVGILALAVVTIDCRRTSSPGSAEKAATTRAAACPADAKKANLNLTLKDIDGKTVKLADYAGKVVLLDFWATWCAPCKVEIPGFIDLYSKYKPRGFEVLGVVVLDRFVNAGPFAKQFKMNYTILDGVDREDVENAYGPLFALPTTFVIARDGRICDKHIGLTTKETFDAAIKSLL